MVGCQRYFYTYWFAGQESRFVLQAERSMAYLCFHKPREVSQAWLSLPGSAKLVSDRRLTKMRFPVISVHLEPTLTRVELNSNMFCIELPLSPDNPRSTGKV